MPNLTLLGWMFLVWSIITAALALLIVYRTVVATKEDDQIFLDTAEARFEEEQHATLTTLDLLSRYIKGLVIASASLMVVMIGLVGYRVWAAR